ncbi:Hypothetical protein CINCED_3A025747 [Cinara cedri]|uniref:Uncharacterized protein n=1 Tax=Cinara cedri TaxID=506608 RepID=A0A5E4MV28_9HEMI|nr:Hypothetical protein CINCED_3A025747 [Cinara cedri]
MNLNLNDAQLKKNKSAHNKKIGVTIQLSNNLIGTGNQRFNLTEKQIIKLNKSKKGKKGSRLELKYEKIKQGGFLPLLFAGIGAASALFGGISSIANTIIERKHKIAAEKEQERHNKEMDKIVNNVKTLQVGCGIKKEISPLTNFDIMKSGKIFEDVL